jgi:segregation and condensation protein A
MAPRHDSPRNDRLSALGVIEPIPIHVQTATFEGSLATLFACAREHRIDLLEVPLFPICEAYFTYLLSMRASDVDEAASALSALAYLLERKAWLLLPVPDPEPEFDEPMELPPPSVHEFAVVMEVLSEWQRERDLLYFRAPEMGPNPYELPYVLANVGVGDLTKALERLLRRADPEPVDSLAKPRRSLQEQMEVVLLALSEAWRPLDELVVGPFTRSEAVYWFLALLELIRLGQAVARIEGEEVEFARA